VTTAEVFRRKWLLWGGAVALVLLFLALNSNVDRFKLPARESSAVGSLRKVVFEQNKFRSQHSCFASELGQLPDVTSRDHDYAYAVMPEATDEKGCVMKFIVTASPVSAQTTRIQILLDG
jgi:hypothetical protein